MAQFFHEDSKIFGLPQKKFFQVTIVSFLTCLIIALFIVPSFLFAPPKYNEGQIAQETIKARQTYDSIVDEERTQEKIAEALAAVRPVFDWDKTFFSEKAQLIAGSFKILREKQMLTDKEILDGKVYLENTLGIKVTDQFFYLARLLKFNEKLENHFITILKQLDSQMIIATQELLPKQAITLRNLKDKDHQESFFDRLIQIKLPATLHADLENRKNQLFEGYKLGARHEFVEFLKSLVSANLTFNKKQSDLKKTQAKESVKPAVIRLLKGDIIISRGEEIQKRHLIILENIHSKKQRQRLTTMVFSIALLLFVMFYILFWYGAEYLKTYAVGFKDLGVMALLLFGAVGGTKLVFFIVDGFMDVYPHIPLTAYQFAIPVAVTAMIVRLLLNHQMALLYSIILSALFGFILEQDFLYSFYTLIASLVGIMGVNQVKERADLYKAGLRVGLVNIITVCAILAMKSSELHFEFFHAPYNLIGAFVGGFASSFIVLALVPVFEFAFHYTTDLKLLELANHNHPLLRRLSLEAPGSYHHSVLVGNLVDAAAGEIGANPLAARVGAYYHDIGKTVKPTYFIENQAGMTNPHDDLNARMSSLIINAHVKEGLELADQYRLGKPVKDAIEQHHGKTVIRYFYERALQNQDPELGEVDPDDYRYPGPKPQTREVALIMLGDAVEAATRTLTKPNPERIRAACEKVVFGFFEDGQLDECDLTLKDLNTSIDCFTRVLMGIYHQRIQYPGEPHENKYSKQSKNKKDSETKGKKVLRALGTRASDRKKS